MIIFASQYQRDLSLFDVTQSTKPLAKLELVCCTYVSSRQDEINILSFKKTVRRVYR